MLFYTFLPNNRQPEAGKGWVVGGYRVLLIIHSKYSSVSDWLKLIPRIFHHNH